MEYNEDDEFEKENEIIGKIKNCKLDVTREGLKNPDRFFDQSRSPYFREKYREILEFHDSIYWRYFWELTERNIPKNIIETEQKSYQESLLAAFYRELAQAIRSYFLAPEIATGVSKQHSLEAYRTRLVQLLDGWEVNERELDRIARRTHKKSQKIFENSTSKYFFNEKGIITERQSHLFGRLFKIFCKYTLLRDKAITRNIARIFIAVGAETEPFNTVFQKWEKHHIRQKQRLI